MVTKELIISHFQSQGLIPLFYHSDSDTCIQAVDALYQAGIRVIEFTNRGEAALTNFKHLIDLKSQKWPELFLGIGTIKSVDDAQNYIDAKADFIICPGVIAEVAKYCHSRQAFWIPGCMTPTEVITAESLGASLVKIFPGNIVGAAFISAVKELFPNLLFMPTGGVEASEDNLKTWFKAGAIAVGMGSKLIDKQTLADKKFNELKLQTIAALQLVQSVKSSV
jgi:2-dehydro-3-deoxyphosphogluconate aldolase / (4S)-4-hydroxy-2-oxoglutarate aldolase